MRHIVFGALLLLALSVSAQAKLEALVRYCKDVRSAYIDNNIEMLEEAIAGYYPSTNTSETEFYFDGISLDLSSWEEGISVKGIDKNDQSLPLQYFDPYSVDNYLASCKGIVILNEIPLLRADKYDFLYKNLPVAANSCIEIKARCLGDTNLIITSNSPNPVILIVRCDNSKYNRKAVLDPEIPLDVFSWFSHTESTFKVSIRNQSDKPITIFIAKD